MNRKMLRAMHGRIVRIRPSVERWDANGWLPPIDDAWQIEAETHLPNVVARLYNLATGHVVNLYTDSVYEYREPGYLILRDQLALMGSTVVRHPLADPRLAYAAVRRRSSDALPTVVRVGV